MKLRYRSTAVLLALVLSMGSTVSLASAKDVGHGEQANDVVKTPPGQAKKGDEPQLQAVVNRPLVMLGDEVVVKAKYKIKIDDAEDGHEPDEGGEVTEGDNTEGDNPGAGSGEETTGGTEDGAVEETDPESGQDNTQVGPATEDTSDAPSDTPTSDPAPTSGGLPTSVAFTVDYGDGMIVDVDPHEVELDEEEFEAEAEGDPYAYAAAGTYTVTVTATPDVGIAQDVTFDVTVTTDPVAYGRGIHRVCPETEEDNADGSDPAEDPDGDGSTDVTDPDGTDSGNTTDPESTEPDGTVVASRFKDVERSAHKHAITCLAGLGIVNGKSATDFAPGAPVTRAQAATLLAQLLADAGVDLTDRPADAFGDDDASVHERAINQLAELGLIGGVSADKFSPNAALSRAQMASLLIGIYGEAAGTELSSELDYFTDDNGSVHEKSVNAAAAAGIALGREARIFGGGGKVTREQLATFLARLLDLLAEEGHVNA